MIKNKINKPLKEKELYEKNIQIYKILRFLK